MSGRGDQPERTYVLDSGAFIAAERASREWDVLWQRMLRLKLVPLVPAGVVGEVWRGGSRAARIACVLLVSDVRALTQSEARAAGELCGRAGTANPIDASVVLLAKPLGATIVTSDPDDIRLLADAADANLPVLAL